MLEADGMRVHRLSTLKYVEVSKMVQAYCVKNRKMVEMKNAKEISPQEWTSCHARRMP